MLEDAGTIVVAIDAVQILKSITKTTMIPLSVSNMVTFKYSNFHPRIVSKDNSKV